MVFSLKPTKMHVYVGVHNQPAPSPPKKRTKTETKCSVWLSNCLAGRCNWHVVLWAMWNPDERWAQTARHNSHAFQHRAAIHESYTVTGMKSYVEAPGGGQELLLQEIPALLHVTAIARKRLSLPIYQKQLLNISAFHLYLIKNRFHLIFSKSMCFLWCLTGNRDVKENILSPSQVVWCIKYLHYHLEFGNGRL